MLTRHALTVVFTLIAPTSLASCSTDNQQECTEPPRVSVLRDATGVSATPLQAGGYVTCDGTTTENQLAMAGGWPSYIAPLGGAGPLEATVSSGSEQLTADYTRQGDTALPDQRSTATRTNGNGRVVIDAPPHAGCWLLTVNVGVGWSMLIDTGLPDTPQCRSTT